MSSPGGRLRQPLYLWIFAVRIFAFGICYLWVALKQKREWLSISIAAVGKLSFAALPAIYWLSGEFSFYTSLAGMDDWAFGCLFVRWLVKNYNDN